MVQQMLHGLWLTGNKSLSQRSLERYRTVFDCWQHLPAALAKCIKRCIWPRAHSVPEQLIRTCSSSGTAQYYTHYTQQRCTMRARSLASGSWATTVDAIRS
jgi:hypothetical protein